MCYSDAEEIAASLAAQIGEDELAKMSTLQIAHFVRRDMPGEGPHTQRAICQALVDARDAVTRL